MSDDITREEIEHWRSIHHDALMSGCSGEGPMSFSRLLTAAERSLDDQARIAALEATVARLTAPVEDDEATRFWKDRDEVGTTAYALTAFLERRMKG